MSDDYIDIITNYRLPKNLEMEVPIDYCEHRLDDEFGIVYLERNKNTDVIARSYTFLPKVYGLSDAVEMYEKNSEKLQHRGEIKAAQFNTLSLVETGILATQGQPLNLTGKKVTIAFIDTGIQYQQQVFLDVIGRSRIRAIWDQTIQTGEPPEGFKFGTEYTNEMLQEALQNENPLSVVPSTDSNGHGTAIASIAAGSRGDGNEEFLGAAPECDIVVVKLKEAKPHLRKYYFIPDGVPCYQENDIMLGLQYVQKFVQNLYRPMVVCLGVGTSLGDHTENTSLSRYMNQLLNSKSRVFVNATGNEGNARHHFYAQLSSQQASRDVEIRVGENHQGFVMDLWGDNPNVFTVTVRTPGGEQIPWINPRIRSPQEYSFVFEDTRLEVEYYLVEPNSGSELIRFRFDKPTQGIWTIRVNLEGVSRNAGFHIWLPITEFLSNESYFLESNPYTTITEPGYVSRAVSVTTYNDANDSLYLNVGRGYARDGQVKPDIAAPGVNVPSILGNRTGSSMAAALTAGGVAQILQWAVVEGNDVFVDSDTIKNYLIRGAIRDSALEYPNREWGFGRLSISGVFEFLAGR